VSNLFHPTVVIADAALDPEQWLFPKQFEATKPGAVVRPTYVVAEVASFSSPVREHGFGPRKVRQPWTGSRLSTSSAGPVENDESTPCSTSNVWPMR